jgi:hypothetical protein
MKRLQRLLVAIALFAVTRTDLYSQGQTAEQAPRPACSRSEEMLDRWNESGTSSLP